ncbi:RTA1 domain-containing protein [Aspergillus saccharolyticus JOP 1030-1]|uniref:Putative RTA1 domain protein n=1 Tax=Aspergillus saccharolyticus JOP 1030-1 TaxID=1450539 RepID=A0A318Z8H6_9EURO|nr:putative RTA1 domain protein [Aspergillus saccharolyticus JOP 1030-1]PYH43469.1 putative RTA1 domain protein [Aspergillus saccharolyticus JOP 1030-1]
MPTESLSPRGHASFDLYAYNPSASAGYAFVVIFALGAAVHLFLLFRLRAWFFIPFFLGCIGEACGYYGRAWSHDNIRDGSPYLLQLMLILGSAPLLSASVYMSLGRIVRALHAESATIMRSTWMTKIYVLIDIGSFVCQMLGSAMQASGDAAGVRTGQPVVIAGLAVQLAALGWFLLEAGAVHRRLSTRPPSAAAREPTLPWRRTMWTLHAGTGLILVRSVYRLVEFLAGTGSVLAQKRRFYRSRQVLLGDPDKITFNARGTNFARMLPRSGKCGKWPVFQHAVRAPWTRPDRATRWIRA